MSINGVRHFLRRALKQGGAVLDIPVQKKRTGTAAKRFLRKLLKGLPRVPRRIVTGKLGSYAAAHKALMPAQTYAGPGLKQPPRRTFTQVPRQRERKKLRFKSVGHMQRVLAVPGAINNVFRVGQPLLKAKHYRITRERAFRLRADRTCTRMPA